MLRYWNAKGREIGCDEAGRGCLAGPVVAAVAYIPSGCKIEGLNDSKKLSECKREKVRKTMIENNIRYAIGMASAQEIDEINILQATFLAMHRAILSFEYPFDRVLVDGNRFKPLEKQGETIEHQCIVKGDSLYLSIAAASIFAKTTRDRYMKEHHEKYPSYGWQQNKGYPTAAHRAAIAEHGPCSQHRTSFSLYSTPSNDV